MSDRAKGVESQIKELKVSGHTMTLEPGLYCVYNAPGGPAAGPGGLPGVRISAAPGNQPGHIDVSSFTPDGWIGSDSAALVRVADSRGDLLVTVYQAQDSRAEAPKLQVVLLSGDPAAPASAPPPDRPGSQPAPAQAATPAPPGPVEVVAHIYGRGDIAGRMGEWMGEPGSQRWIEGFGIAPPEGIEPTDIEYQAVLGRGWLSPWSEGGQFCGSRGMSLPILGMRVRLRGEAAKANRIVLSASFVDGARIGPVGDGEPCEAASLAALEAFQVALEPIDAKPAAKPGRKPAAKAAPEPTPPEKPARQKAQPPAAAPEPEVKRKPGRPKAVTAPARPARGGAKPTPPATRRR